MFSRAWLIGLAPDLEPLLIPDAGLGRLFPSLGVCDWVVKPQELFVHSAQSPLLQQWSLAEEELGKHLGTFLALTAVSCPFQRLRGIPESAVATNPPAKEGQQQEGLP